MYSDLVLLLGMVGPALCTAVPIEPDTSPNPAKRKPLLLLVPLLTLLSPTTPSHQGGRPRAVPASVQRAWTTPRRQQV
jgi:hypothetical protein